MANVTVVKPEFKFVVISTNYSYKLFRDYDADDKRVKEGKDEPMGKMVFREVAKSVKGQAEFLGVVDDGFGRMEEPRVKCCVTSSDTSETKHHKKEILRTIAEILKVKGEMVDGLVFKPSPSFPLGFLTEAMKAMKNGGKAQHCAYLCMMNILYFHSPEISFALVKCDSESG